MLPRLYLLVGSDQGTDNVSYIAVLDSQKHKKMSVFGGIYTTGKKFYIAGGSDGIDKSHLCLSFSRTD